jgi:hypothetical protein
MASHWVKQASVPLLVGGVPAGYPEGDVVKSGARDTGTRSLSAALPAARFVQGCALRIGSWVVLMNKSRNSGRGWGLSWRRSSATLGFTHGCEEQQ